MVTSKLSLTRRRDRQVLSVGYLALDAVLYKSQAALRAGGTAGNVASNLAFLGWQSNVFGRVGSDLLGQSLHADLREAGVGTQHLESTEDASTPVVFHHVREDGPRYTFRCPGCGRKLGRHCPPKPDAAARFLEEAELPDVLFFDRVSKGTIHMAETARECGTLVVFEPSTIGVAHLFKRAIQLAHVVKYSSQRAKAVETALPRRPTGQIRIVTNGADGLSVGGTRGWKRVGGFKADVVDEAGAGDWTTAAFLTALPTVVPDELDDELVREALRLAQAVAALSCSFIGARGMSFAWTRSTLVERTNRLLAENSPGRTRKQAAGRWFARDALVARLCAPPCERQN